MSTEKEMKLIVKLAIAEADLKFTEELGVIKLEIASFSQKVADKIHECQIMRDRRRRWSIGTILNFAGVLTAIVVAFAAHWR